MITRPYRLLMLQGTRVLFCLVCDTYSANAHDIAHHYCGRCHLWLDDLPEDYRRLRGGDEEACLTLDLDPDVHREEEPHA